MPVRLHIYCVFLFQLNKFHFDYVCACGDIDCPTVNCSQEYLNMGCVRVRGCIRRIKAIEASL